MPGLRERLSGWSAPVPVKWKAWPHIPSSSNTWMERRCWVQEWAAPDEDEDDDDERLLQCILHETNLPCVTCTECPPCLWGVKWTWAGRMSHPPTSPPLWVQICLAATGMSSTCRRRQWDGPLCQRRWSTANMQLSDPITFSGRARLLLPRRAPPVLHKQFSQAPHRSASLQTLTGFCICLYVHVALTGRRWEYGFDLCVESSHINELVYVLPPPPPVHQHPSEDEAVFSGQGGRLLRSLAALLAGENKMSLLFNTEMQDGVNAGGLQMKVRNTSGLKVELNSAEYESHGFWLFK